MKKLSGWKTKGMNRDLSVSAFNPEFAFENMNLRLSTNEGNTTLSWVNEKGTAPLTALQRRGRGASMGPINIPGICIGTAVLNGYLVLFITKGGDTYNKDCIYRLNHIRDGHMQIELLYEGNLNFRPDHPLETMVSYEAEDIQKVYWTDAVNSEDNLKWNQPRVINIVSDSIREDLDTQFDFIPTLQLTEIVKVRKVTGGGGMFAPGVIQYAFTYYYKHGQETNIFYTTPLIYISHIDRGASPEDKVDNIFKITIKRLDTHFDFLRIYSIQRTSINATPICKRIQDIAIEGEVLSSKSASFTDVGTTGNSIDPTELLYKGGSPIAVGTMEQKDNTLFMGDVATPRMDDLTVFESGARTWKLKDVIHPRVITRTFYPIQTSTGDYEYANQLNSYDTTDGTGSSVPCAGFKYGNRYRCGIQFQDKWGRWTTPVWLEDLDILNSNSDEDDVHPAINKASSDEPEGGGGEGGEDTSNDLSIIVDFYNDTTTDINISSTVYFILEDGTQLPVTLFNNAEYDAIAFSSGGLEHKTYYPIVRNGKLHAGKKFASTEQYTAMGLSSNLLMSSNLYTYTLDAMDSNVVFGDEDSHRYEVKCSTFQQKATPDPDPVVPDPTPTPSSADPSTATYTGENGIRFKITNNTGVEARLSGKVILNVSKSATDWGNSTQVNANMHGPTSGSSWAYNDIIIPAGGSFTSNLITTIDGIYYPSYNFTDGTWYLMNADNGIYVHAIYLYSRMWSRSKAARGEDPYSGSNHMYVAAPCQNTLLQKGYTYNLNLYWKNPDASLDPDQSGTGYIILAEGQTRLLGNS